jgi:S1-C subfamily serine protease
MKTWLGLTFCLCFLSAWVYSQPNTTLYYDLDGKKCEASYALFSLTAPANQHVEGYYTNGKSFFRGSIARLDTANFYASKFVDSCVWYYKNGKQKLVRNYDKTGLLEGISREYYESGSLWKEMNYSHNAIENNTYAEFLEDGQRYEIFEDNFNDNQSDWDLLQNESQDVKIADGHLVLTGKTKDGTSRYKYLKFNKEDFIIEMKFDFQKNKNEDNGGMIYGFKDWDNYNFFYINQENFFIGTVYEGIKSYAVEDMFSAAIHDKGYNVLKIISNGSDVVYTINGSLVYKSSKYNFYGNHFGAALVAKCTMRIDQLVFKQISYSAMGHGSESKAQQNVDVKATGTGFFIDASGIIATNYHVVENEKQIIVDVLDTASGMYKSYKANLLMKDEDNDLAVIKISDEQFKPMFGGIDYAFSSSHSFELGGNAFTLGFPLALAGMGSGEVKFSDGKISARTGYNGALNSFQTSIPVQPGNSGGPVFNQNGELIGIINSKIAKADNVSYAIKYNFLINLLQSLPENVNLPSNNKLATYSLEEKIKNVKKYIVLIKIK